MTIDDMHNSLNKYIGQKGYTILKSSLTKAECKMIETDLTIKPFTAMKIFSDNKTFPVYRESANKYYLPRYYGVEKFGPPTEYQIHNCVTIDVPFVGNRRDYQIPVIDKFINHCQTNECGGGLLELPCAWGKTSAALYITHSLGLKAIVIVGKEFLMNQWIERIHQFLPTARIGKIQGQVMDIEDKDIVLCMLKSLVEIPYPQSLFSSFGLTIIDEVHHISSQTFSNALFKVVTKHMLGLSATMERKDGTTHVFKMFLGDVIHKAKRDAGDCVEVKAIYYKSDDPLFNELILDFRGSVQNSSMITKVCEYNQRTEFIIRVLADFISKHDISDAAYSQFKQEQLDAQAPCAMCNGHSHYLVKNTCCNVVKYCLNCMQEEHAAAHSSDNTSKISKTSNTSNVIAPRRGQGADGGPRPPRKCPNCSKKLKFTQNYIDDPHVKPLSERHTIIMAHNLNILRYIYSKIVSHNMASVGFYVGGMSEADLKESETKQIVLATYSMAQEALDIPTLNTEFLITSKTDVVQTIGRILRAKRTDGIHPTVFDFVDDHYNFKNQWNKRKAYYKSQNYKIYKCVSNHYFAPTVTEKTRWTKVN